MYILRGRLAKIAQKQTNGPLWVDIESQDLYDKVYSIDTYNKSIPI